MSQILQTVVFEEVDHRMGLSWGAIKRIIKPMSDFQITEDTAVNLKQKLLDALRQETLKSGQLDNASFISKKSSEIFPGLENRPTGNPEKLVGEQINASTLSESDKSRILDVSKPDQAHPPKHSSTTFKKSSQGNSDIQGKNSVKSDFDDKLSMRGPVPNMAASTATQPTNAPPAIKPSQPQTKSVNLESVISGGSMADLSGYKDLSKAPMSFGDEDLPLSSLAPEAPYERASHMTAQQSYVQDLPAQEVDTEFSGNVKTLIRLVNELPEGVTKQTGAQIIRLTMEAMGISMEDVLSEAQSAQSEMLDAVRANIKKIEEYKTVIRKLETDIKYYQGKANELSEIIDLFILSNTSGNKTPGSDY